MTLYQSINCYEFNSFVNMKKNHFIYADLSTYDLKTAMKFYTTVFDWEYYNSGEDYWIALANNKEATGLYETPQKFQEMNMPSFWMSYIQVNSVEETVDLARALGGIVELVDLEASIGKIALIRDPLGAGFTVYEGDRLNVRTKDTLNTLVWNELFISDLSKVKDFYEGIFQWTIDVNNATYQHFIYDTSGDQVGAISEVSDIIRGKYQYWGVYFAVNDIQEAKQKALDNGGSVVYEDENMTIIADSYGAFFHLVA